MMLLVFLIKVAVPPVLVAGMSLAARRWGATFGGLIMGLPWMTGPVLFFLALDKGPQFASGAIVGIELGVLSIVAYMFAYALVSSVAAWPFSLVAGMLAFVGAGLLLQFVTVGLGVATGLALGALGATYLLLPKPRGAPLPVALPAWDIPARMLVTFVLVSIIMTGADVLGSRLSGIFSTYPVILTVIGTFTHAQSGVDAVRRLLRGLALSLTSFAAFFAAVGWTLPKLGLTGAYLVGAVVAIAISAGLIAVMRR